MEFEEFSETRRKATAKDNTSASMIYEENENQPILTYLGVTGGVFIAIHRDSYSLILGNHESVAPLTCEGLEELELELFDWVGDHR